MAGSTEGVLLKIERARSHLHAIEEAEESFMKTAFDSVTQEFDAETGEYFFVLPEAVRPPREIELLVGDCLNNLRSALDHLAWQLVHFPSVDPGVPKTRDRDIAFPICDSPYFFESGVKKIQGVAPDAQTIIERRQPYNVRKDNPKLTCLAMLRDLNDWDKHRLLHLVENRIEGIGFLHNDRCDFQVASAGVAKTGTELARYKVRPGLDPKMDVGFYITTAVAFDEGPAKYRVVKMTLAGILFDVRQTVSSLSPYIAT